MLRSAKLFLFCFSVAIVLVNCRSAQAQLNTYEMGPFTVNGAGLTPTEAQSNAYGNLYDALLDIEANLPEGHVLLEFVIEDEDWINPNLYYIDFHVVIGVTNPPGPPSGT